MLDTSRNGGTVPAYFVIVALEFSIHIRDCECGILKYFFTLALLIRLPIDGEFSNFKWNPPCFVG